MESKDKKKLVNVPQKNIKTRLIEGSLTEDKIDDSKPIEVNHISEGDEAKLLTYKPTKAQLKLIEQYKVHNPAQLVKNTVDKLMIEELPYIKQALENLEKYSDRKIYGMLPKELDEFIRTYCMIITEWYGKTDRSIRNSSVLVVPETYKKCGKCKKYKSAYNGFHMSASDTDDGFLHICKECANKLLKEYYNKYKDMRETIILLSQKLDIYVDAILLDKYTARFDTALGKEEFRENTFFDNYLAELYIFIDLDNSEKKFTFSDSVLGGIPFKCVEEHHAPVSVYNDRIVEGESNELIEEEMDLPMFKRLSKKWGTEDKRDIKFLESRMSELEYQFDISGLNAQILVKQLCLEELNLNHIRRDGGDTQKTLNNIMKLMNELNLTPKKAKDANGATFDSLSSAIKIFEKKRAVTHEDPEFEDVDNIGKIRDSYVGTLQRTLQEQTEYVKKFEENYAEYTVDILGEAENGDN